MTTEKRPHYVDNKQLVKSLIEYTKLVKEAKQNNNPLPIVPDYIARCLMDISEGLSHKSNFIRYTYREDMVLDGIEDCLKAIENYDPTTYTRTGTPNAFGYFTQICFYAFLRRIQKENKEQDIKMKFIEQSGIEEFISQLEYDNTNEEQAFIEVLKQRINRVKEKDSALKEYIKKEKANKGLDNFIEASK